MSSKIVVPELSESVSEARVGRWLKEEGDRVSVGEPVVELETDKVDLEVGAETSGVLASILHDEGDEVHAGDELAVIEPADDDLGSEQETGQAKSEQSTEVEASRSEKPASPSARRLALEKDVDLTDVAEIVERGRIGREDVERFLERRKPDEPRPTRERPGDQAEKSRPEELVRMSSRRRTIARRLVEARRNAAMLTTFNEIDVTRLMALRQRQREGFLERHGVRLGIVSFFVRASIGALRAFPRLNAEVRGDDMLLKRYYDIGIAVGDAEGLVVPVLRDADKLSLAQIERRIHELVSRAEKGQLTPNDLAGGTFTITNGGVFGSLMSTPILNPPQVGILGLHKIEERPIVVDARIEARPMMYVALSYDHRIVDGREAVQFLVRVKELVDSPEMLLLEG